MVCLFTNQYIKPSIKLVLIWLWCLSIIEDVKVCSLCCVMAQRGKGVVLCWVSGFPHVSLCQHKPRGSMGSWRCAEHHSWWESHRDIVPLPSLPLCAALIAALRSETEELRPSWHQHFLEYQDFVELCYLVCCIPLGLEISEKGHADSTGTSEVGQGIYIKHRENIICKLCFHFPQERPRSVWKRGAFLSVQDFY